MAVNAGSIFSLPALTIGNAPATVITSFNSKFPNANNVKWGKENATEWEAEFELNGSKVSANFSNDGKWLETETEVSVNQLPKAVVSAINKKYPDYEIAGGDKIENAKGEILYEADIKFKTVRKEVLLNSDGTFKN